jgi:magnesium chelatase family protein
MKLPAAVRLPQRPNPRVPVHPSHDPALHFENLRPADGSDRHYIDVPAVNYKEMRSTNEPECSAKIRERVIRTRQKQLERFASSREKIYCNAQMSSRHIRAFCELSADCERLLERAMTQQGLSARAHDRILKVARTIADFEDTPQIEPKHIAEAIQYRSLDRTYWT